MPMKYRHLTTEERDKLAVLRGQGKSLREIAAELGRNHTTLSREIKRNGAPVRTCNYLAHRAQARAVARRQAASRRGRIRDHWARQFITSNIRRGTSPELTAGLMKKLRRPKSFSYEAIYQWIYSEVEELIPFLPRKHRIRRGRRWTMRSKKTRIAGRIHISERPTVVDTRSRFGDWETDTIGRRGKGPVLQIIVERKSRYTILNKLARKDAKHMRRALVRSLIKFPPKWRRTITYDNGGENAEHLLANAALGTKSYFCTPYTAQERGTTENRAGLTRRIFPKATLFGNVSLRAVKRAERWINRRPMKIHNFRSSAEVARSGGALRS